MTAVLETQAVTAEEPGGGAKWMLRDWRNEAGRHLRAMPRNLDILIFNSDTCPSDEAGGHGRLKPTRELEKIIEFAGPRGGQPRRRLRQQELTTVR